MAYMSQEKKKAIATQLKRVIPKDWKYSLAVRHRSVLVLTIYAAPVDFIGSNRTIAKQQPGSRYDAQPNPTYLDVNPHWFREHFTPDVVATLEPIFAALNDGNFDKSDLQTDYFHVGWYVDVNIGTWERPFVFTGAPPPAKPRMRFDQGQAAWQQVAA